MLTEANTDSLIKRNAIKKGLILGVILSALSIFSFYFITAITKVMWLIVFGPFLFSIIIPIIVTVFLCLDMRKNIGGYWKFKQAVTGIFIMFLVSYAVQTVVRDYIFARVIEPDMIQKTEVVMLGVKTKTLDASGLTKKEKDAQIADMRKEFDTQKNTTVGAIIQGIILNIIMLFVVALVFAAIFKKEPPLIVKADVNTPAV